jgi:hypothetical protein
MINFLLWLIFRERLIGKPPLPLAKLVTPCDCRGRKEAYKPYSERSQQLEIEK